MCISCLVTKATNVHSEYVILIACPLQQWLYERYSLLRFTYIACLVVYYYSISRDSSVGVVIKLGLNDRGILFRFFRKALRSALGPTRLPIQCVLAALFAAVKHPERKPTNRLHQLQSLRMRGS
jgi:hypothetical protein